MFREMELSGCNIKKFLIFSQKKAFLILWKSRKNSLHFRKRNFLIFQETETLKSFLYFMNFGKWYFLAPSLKNFLYFRKELTGPENHTKNLP